ncbi:MAG: 2OG-Fe(II) oxygenase [Nannocystaceae bacterium]|nr:2OG-Fe(II) oxygenase [bacterium]
MHADLEKVIAALEPLARGGTFAARRSVDAQHLALSVKGLGALELPLSADAGRQLVAQAVQSPFGWGERTVVDRSVRDGWQIAKSRLKIDGRRWNPVLRGALAELASALGLPSSATLVPKLDKMTIYGPGQFFKPHKDTEKTDAMIGSLVVLLPSRHTGGALRVEHGGRRYEVRRTVRRAPKIDLVAFYADCVHEVRPVKSGFRVALVYGLEVRSKASAKARRSRAPTLQRAVQSYFESSAPRTDKLVYLLDHQYTPANLGWNRLKGADGPRVRALCEVADALALDAHLCLASIEERWQCEEPFDARRYGRWRWGDDDDEDEDTDEDDVIPTDLIDFDVRLLEGRGRDDSVSPLGGLDVRESEICASTPNGSIEPAESHYEGYMGNYGSTLDRRYERAAVVLWPHSRAFAMVVDGDPAGALRVVVDGLRAGRAEARGQLSILLERIHDKRGVRSDAAAWSTALELGTALDDEAAARGLLEPLGPDLKRVPLGSVKPFIALVNRYGESFGRALLAAWHGARGRGFSVYSPTWVQRVSHGGGAAGKRVAAIVADGQVDAALQTLEANARWRNPSPYAGMKTRGTRAEVSAIAEALASCVAAPAREPFERCIAAVVDGRGALTASELAGVALGLKLPDEARAWMTKSAQRLSSAAATAVESAAERAARRRGDWAIEIPQRCRCPDCDSLHAFLRGPERSVELPLNKARRKHLHREIDAAGLPVRHTTDRAGSPFVFVLHKQDSLHTLDRQLRKKALAELKQLRAQLRRL